VNSSKQFKLEERKIKPAGKSFEGKDQLIVVRRKEAASWAHRDIFTFGTAGSALASPFNVFLQA
jgi:hypothetical protein